MSIGADDLVPWPVGRDAALVEDEEVVAGGDGRGAVGHDDDALAFGLHGVDHGVQRLGPFGVERGVRLVEDEEDGVAVKRAGQREALLLAAGEAAVGGAEAGVVAFGELEDDVVDMGLLRRRDHAVGVGRGRHAGDVLGHGAVEEADLLRQVAHVAAEAVGPVLRRASRRRGGPRPRSGGSGP